MSGVWRLFRPLTSLRMTHLGWWAARPPLSDQGTLDILKPTVHEFAGFRTFIDEQEVAAVASGGHASGPAAGEEVEDRVAGVGVDADDAFQDAEGLLRGVAGFFFAGWGDDGVPPDVGGGLAAGGFFGADERGGHVGNAVRGREVEGVAGGVFGVPEDVVVLGGPALGGARTVVVRPDDFVLETGAAGGRGRGEDFVEQHLAVVDFARVDVEEERAGGGEDAVGFGEAGAEEAEVVVEGVGVAGGVGGALGAIAVAAEAGAVAGVVADGLEAGAGLGGAGVEGWVDVDELDAGVREGAQGGEVFGVEDAVHGGFFIVCAVLLESFNAKFAEGAKFREGSWG